MTYSELKEHCEGEGCSFDHLGDNVYLAKNCINGHVCVVEDIPFYSIATLAHYFYELNIAVPYEVEDFIHIYNNFRDNHLEPIESEE